MGVLRIEDIHARRIDVPLFVSACGPIHLHPVHPSRKHLLLPERIVPNIIDHFLFRLLHRHIRIVPAVVGVVRRILVHVHQHVIGIVVLDIFLASGIPGEVFQRVLVYGVREMELIQQLPHRHLFQGLDLSQGALFEVGAELSAVTASQRDVALHVHYAAADGMVGGALRVPDDILELQVPVGIALQEIAFLQLLEMLSRVHGRRSPHDPHDALLQIGFFSVLFVLGIAVAHHGADDS